LFSNNRDSHKPWCYHPVAQTIIEQRSFQINFKQFKASRKGDFVMALLNIPEDITITEFAQILNHLNTLRNDVGASQVSMRLNESNRNGSDPGAGSPFFDFSYFVGSVQDSVTTANRRALNIPDPGLYRFGDNVTSKEIREAVAKTVSGSSNLFANRGWPDISSSQKKGMGSKGMGRESGLKFQKYIGIKIGGRCVGTLGVSFIDPLPSNMQAVEAKIVGWAREPASPATLLNYLTITFNLWGPACP
jgi:hypothetical protein